MKRDLDLVRAILKDVEETPAGQIISGLEFDGYDKADVGEHVHLLLDAGFLKGEIVRAMDGQYFMAIQGLTWKGHDFVNAAKADSVWKPVKEKLLKSAVGFTFDLVVELLKAEAKRQMALDL